LNSKGKTERLSVSVDSPHMLPWTYCMII